MTNLKVSPVKYLAGKLGRGRRNPRRTTWSDEDKSATLRPHYVAGALAIFAALFIVLSGGCAHADEIHDRFDTEKFQRSIWDPCIRPESEMSIIYLPLEKFYAGKFLVHHYPRPGDMESTMDQPIEKIHAGELPMHGYPRLAGEPKRDCYAQNDKSERAELWEADGVWLKLGTEVWYAFTMYIDPSISPNEQRLVIGQWKGLYDRSPMIAQRFTHHRFTITVEQDNDASGGDPRDAQCRIYIAHDEHLPAGGDEDQPYHLRSQSGTDIFADSVAHDLDEVVHTPNRSCARDIEIERYNNLPDVFGQWTKMLYHIKATTDSTGILEVWANGKPIVSVRGRFGLRANRGSAQRFKFGPYRNRPGTNDIYAMMGQYTRALRKEDIP